jgi:hypothetical protein
MTSLFGIISQNLPQLLGGGLLYVQHSSSSGNKKVRSRSYALKNAEAPIAATQLQTHPKACGKEHAFLPK